MKEIKIYKSAWKAIRIILLFTPLVFIGIWMIIEEGGSLLAYAIIGFLVTVLVNLS